MAMMVQPAESSVFVGAEFGLVLHLLQFRGKAFVAAGIRINPLLRELLPQVAFGKAEFKAMRRDCTIQYSQHIFRNCVAAHLLETARLGRDASPCHEPKSRVWGGANPPGKPFPDAI